VTYLLRQNERIPHQLIQPGLQLALILLKRHLGRIVKQIRRLDGAVLLVADDRALEIVEAEEIRDLLRLGIFDNIAPHDLLLWLLFRRHPVLKLRLVEHLRHVHTREVALQQVDCRIHILAFNLAEARGRRHVGKFVADDLALLCAVVRERGEADVVQLLPVDCAVEVAACGHGSGKQGADGVDGLEGAFDVAAAGDFLDEDRGEAFGAQFLVYAEEVDFGAVERLLADAQGDGDAGDEGDELARAGCADADVPLFLPAGRFEGPAVVSLGSGSAR
jgi:hypothetical protein